MKYELTSEIYCIPHNDKFILYAPLKRLVCLVNQDTVKLLELIRGERVPEELSSNAVRVIDTFIRWELVNGKPDHYPNLSSSTSPNFFPTSVTIFPSYDCNLHCIYCYSSGGENILTMPLEIAMASIDLVCENAIKIKKKSFQVNFHGGGEPTINWKLFVSIVEYAQRKAAINKLTTSSTMASNCILSKSQVEWISNNLRHVNVSIDGTPDIQNSQRPLKNGGDSFSIVAQTLRQFDRLKFPYGIRSTITSNSVSKLSEIVLFFCEEWNPKSIHLEPLFECGRCSTTNTKAPDEKTFLDEFIKAHEIAWQHKIDLYYSGSRLRSLTSTFCGAVGRNFIVLPDGSVTSCNEVCRANDPRSTIFSMGITITRLNRLFLIITV